MSSASLCKATKANGEPCTLPANGPQGLCWAHDPKNAQARRKGASRGGKGKAASETRDIKKLMDDLTTRVLEGVLEPPVVHAVVALQNIKLRTLEVERKIKEAEEIEERLTALEEKQRQRQPMKGARRW